MTLLGQFSLWVALLLGVWAAVVSFSGRWQDRPQLAASVSGAVYGIFAALVVASIALWKGLAAHDFNIEYVAAYTSRNLPPGYIFSAFWAGQKGSLLFWAVVLSLFGALAQLLTARRYARCCRTWAASPPRWSPSSSAPCCSPPIRSSGWRSPRRTGGGSIPSCRTRG